MNDDQKHWRILIVDDTPINIELLRIMLENTYHISEACNGSEALETARKEKPDLILLDVIMPGMDGYEVCMRLKADPVTAKIPVIFVTSMEADTDEERGFKVGAADYITKPISPSTVLARISTHLALYDQKNSFELQLKERTKELEESKRKLETALEDSEKANLLKREFLATMGHELRTPLNGVSGAIQLLQDRVCTAEEKELINMAYQSTTNLAQLVNNILSFIEVQAGELVSKLDETKLIPFLNKRLSAFPWEKSRVYLETDFSSLESRSVILDQDHLSTVISHLVSNAFKFTTIGKIIFKAELKSEDKKTNLHISVKDTGVGFATEQLEAVWDIFRQVDGSFARKQQGIGLGLPLTKGLVEMMDGSISITSEKGIGTEVSIVIPVKLPETKQTKAARSEPGKSTTRPTILVVEDNPINMKLTQKMLEALGYQSLPAFDGKEALDVFRKYHSKISLVLMDCQMPIMNGYDATQNIRDMDNGNNVPIVALTANVSDTDVKTCLAVGMNAHLGKPVTMEQLKTTVEEWLHIPG